MESKQSNIRKNYVGGRCTHRQKEERNYLTMQQKTNKDVLKELTAAKKRIDKQKAELIKEKNKLEAAKGEQPNGEAFNLNAIFNSKSREEINRKIASIDAALALPYYADSEYRRLSIEYMEVITAEAAGELAKKESEIETTEKAIEQAQERIEHLKKEKEDIRGAAADKADKIGLIIFSSEFLDYSPDYIFRKYKNLCDKYN